MNYIDLNGKLVQQTTSQDKLLDDLYRHMLGRLLLKPLVTPAVSRLAGTLLSSPFSTRLIPHFIESNNIDMSAYEKRKYRSFNDFFTRRIQEGKMKKRYLSVPVTARQQFIKYRKTPFFQ